VTLCLSISCTCLPDVSGTVVASSCCICNLFLPAGRIHGFSDSHARCYSALCAAVGDAALCPAVVFAVLEAELTRQADSRVRALYLDPTATHCLIVIKTASSFEVHYMHSSWTKARVLSKLKGLQVSAVGWQKQPSSGEEGRPGSSGSSRSSKPPAADTAGDDLWLSTTG